MSDTESDKGGWKGDMHVHGWIGGLDAAQLFGAGLAVMLCAQQLAVWRWERRGSSAAAVGASAAAVAVVLTVNVVYLAERATGAADMLLFVRSLALNALVLSVLPLGSTLTRRRPPRWLAGALIAIVAARTLLWPTTHLFVTHRSTHGYAEYGPWSAPAAVLVLVLLFGYLFHVAISTSERRERAALVSALFVSLVLAAASVTTTSRLAAELLTGYTTVPALAGVTALLWMRQNHAQRRLARLATRQQAVAEVAALAVDQPLDVVRAAAERAIRGDAALRTSTKPLSLACLLDDPTTQAAVADPDDREFLVSLTGVVTAAAAARRANAELARRATVDELTGLANRTAFYQLVTNTLCEGGGSSQRIAVIVCNIDRFTTINEAYGHEVGDEVLRVIAARLRDCGDTSQHVARLGGDEFGLVCLAAAGTEGIERLVEACHQVFRDSINVGAVRVHVGASIGVSVSVPDDDTFADTLIRDALIATHDAKQRGLSTRRFDNDLRKAVILRADVEQRLVGAVGRGEIVVHYQPIVDLNTGATSGFEALARWQRDGQLVQPSQWISVAESSDLIHDIGTEILIAAARQTERWRAGGADLAINVNVSARQLADPRLATALLTAITHVPKSRLVIEITESLAIDDIAHCTLASLRRLGVRTSLDDFGTGYSALAAIARLPIDQIKIGQEITDRVTQPDGNALVHATVSIANTFDLSVVAEGVESRPQHDALIAAGCHLAQGYLYGKPMSAHDATKWLALHPADAQSEHQAAHQLGCA